MTHLASVPRRGLDFSKGEMAMSITRILVVLKSCYKTLPGSALACTLLIAFAAVPLHAQFTCQDLYDFNCTTGGCNPYDIGSLLQVGSGVLNGTTSDGVDGYGTIFEVSTLPPVSYGDFFDFTLSYGAYPFGAVSSDANGNLYVATNGGGAYGNGTLFSFYFEVPFDMHDFTTAEGTGLASPIPGKDGNLYGVTSGGSTYTVIVTSTSSAYSSLGTLAPGAPNGPLFLASDGNLYGTTYTGGTHNVGSIFRMTTPKGTINTMHNFTNGKNGSYPSGPLVQGADGNLYGTTTIGGINNTGVIFKITLKGVYTKMFDFDAAPGGCNKFGATPYAGLMAAPDGNLYGVTPIGGANCVGTIFQVTTGGSVSKLFDFTGNTGAVPGFYSTTTLALNTNGKFYGLTVSGGANGDGVLFNVTPLNLKELLTVVGPIFVEPGLPVEILGNDLTHTVQVSFGGVQAQFQQGSDTYLIATVPTDAVDGVIAVTLDTGLQVQTLLAIHILPLITNLDPPSGPVGTQVGIVGGGFAAAAKVIFGGVAATDFTIVSPSLIQAIVPTGAKSGKVKVTTPNGTAISTEKFAVN
jgi:uncharacterized repeat protein (TIGR03803 family)